MRIGEVGDGERGGVDLSGQRGGHLAQGARRRVHGVDECSACPELLVGHDLGDVEHRRHAGVGRPQFGGPFVAGSGGEGGGEVGPHGVDGIVVVLALDPLSTAECPAEVGEEAGLDGAHGQPAAVGRLVEVVPGVTAGEKAVAGTGFNAFGQVLVDGERHERQHAVGDRDVEMGTLAGGGPGGERGADGGHGLEPAAGRVGDRGAGQCWCATLVAARAVQVAADGQVVDVVSGPCSPGAGLAESGRRAQHDAGVGGPQGVVADAQPVDHSGTETLDDDVGGSGEAQEGVAAGIGLEVEHHPAHAAVGAVGVGGWCDLEVAVGRHRPDLDHGCTPVGQPARCPHGRAHGGQVQHRDSLEQRSVCHVRA